LSITRGKGREKERGIKAGKTLPPIRKKIVASTYLGLGFTRPKKNRRAELERGEPRSLLRTEAFYENLALACRSKRKIHGEGDTGERNEKCKSRKRTKKSKCRRNLCRRNGTYLDRKFWGGSGHQ